MIHTNLASKVVTTGVQTTATAVVTAVGTLLFIGSTLFRSSSSSSSGSSSSTSLHRALVMSTVWSSSSSRGTTHCDALSTKSPNISDSIQRSLPELYDTPLKPIVDYTKDPITGHVQVNLDDQTKTTLRSAANTAQSPYVPSVCFVIRRPGCVLCREHGLQLVQLHATAQQTTTVTKEGKALIPFHLWGIVKEIGVDDMGLMEFQSDYFQNLPLYYDIQNAIYDAFGRRSIFTLRTWNPISLYRGFTNVRERVATQNITGNYKGEGMIQGGVLIFDSTGTLRYSFNEEIGTPFDMDAIYTALEDITVSNVIAEDDKESLEGTERTVNEL